ncbi:hypothetical protein CUMW_136380 [Citrus unshiu]|nr:hypothetical protein CUMW_136380 [Citrus unshiu]
MRERKRNLYKSDTAEVESFRFLSARCCKRGFSEISDISKKVLCSLCPDLCIHTFQFGWKT